VTRTRLNRHAVEQRVLAGIERRWADPNRGIYRVRRLPDSVSVWLTTAYDYLDAEVSLTAAGYRVRRDPAQPDAGSRMIVELPGRAS